MTNFFNIIESDVTYTEALEKISANVLYNGLKSAQAVLEQKEADKFNDGKGREVGEWRLRKTSGLPWRA